MKLKLKIGHHVSTAKSIDLAFDRARAMHYTAMQLFVSNPRKWRADMPRNEQIDSFKAKHNAFGIEPVAHMPYLPNLASSNKEIYSKSLEAFNEQINLCKILGIRKLVVHPGSNKNRKEGIENVANAANSIEHKGVELVIENSALQGNSIGDLNEVFEIYDLIEGEKGICIDTCHTFAAGYEINAGFVKLFEGMHGFDYLSVIHLNDSKYELNSRKDRHENIGFGKIGTKNFASFFSSFPISKLESTSIILETPSSEKISEAAEFGLVKRIISNAAKL